MKNKTEEKTIIKYRYKPKHKNYLFCVYKIVNGWKIPIKRGFIKNLPEGITLNYSNTI